MEFCWFAPWLFSRVPNYFNLRWLTSSSRRFRSRVFPFGKNNDIITRETHKNLVTVGNHLFTISTSTVGSPLLTGTSKEPVMLQGTYENHNPETWRQPEGNATLHIKVQPPSEKSFKGSSISEAPGIQNVKQDLQGLKLWAQLYNPCTTLKITETALMIWHFSFAVFPTLRPWK